MKGKEKKVNRSIRRITCWMGMLLAAMIAYLIYFLVFQREHIINNPYNSRVDSFAERVEKGKIRSRDGTILAETIKQEDGRECRVYPEGELFDHVIGYTSMGKTGVEALGNFYLLSSHTNALERVVLELSGQKSSGDDVYTTLDRNLQQAAYDALGDRKGAVIVLEPDTGKILAMVSKPGYDPNQLEMSWEELLQDEGNARLLNRGTQGLYPPGSVFKLVTLLEYIRENPDTYEEYRFDCDGIYEAEGYTIQCYHQNAHGMQTLEEAFANSCNGAFASLGLELDPVRMTETAESLLYNQELPLSIAYSKSSFSLSSDSAAWERSQTAIGQGKTQTTPVQIAMMTAAIANGGILMKPYLLDHVENVEGKLVRQFLPEAYGSLMTAEESAYLTRVLAKVVQEGTASRLQSESYTAAGKTGSAEFEKGRETHAWFTGFAPVERPRVVVTVLVEESGSGGNVAAPAAKQIFDAYFQENG